MMDALLHRAQQLADQPVTPLSAPIKGRVAYMVSHGQSYASNGYAIRTQGIAQSMNKHGFETLCFVRPGRPWELDQSVADISPETMVENVRYIHSRWLKKPQDEVEHLEASVERFIELFRVYRPATVLAASNYIVGLPAWVAAKRLGLPFYNEVRGFWELSKSAREPGYEYTSAFNAERERDAFVAKQAVKVFTLNQPMKTELECRGIEKNNVEIVSNGVSELPELVQADPRLRSQLGIEEDDKVVGYVGSFNAYEGLDILIEACEQLIQQGEKLKLLLVGDDQPLTDAKGISKVLANYPWLLQVGRIPHAQVGRYYSLIDTVVIPRRELAVCELVPPMKATEALAFGKQVVVSDVAPLVELAEHYKGAKTFETGNLDSLKKAIISGMASKGKEPNITLSLNPAKMVESLIPVLPPSEKIKTDFSLVSRDVGKKKTKWTNVNVDSLKKLSVYAESTPKISDKKLIVRVRCFDENLVEIKPEANSAYYSQAYSWFRYLTVHDSKGGSTRSSVDIPVGEKTKFMGLSVVNIGDADVSCLSMRLVKEAEEKSTVPDEKELQENVFNYLIGNKESLRAKAIIYGDVSPNVLDGSSIWLTSITNIIASGREAILLLKDNVKNNKVVSNISKSDFLTIIEPQDIGFEGPLTQKAAANAISLIYSHCPEVKAIITRGVDIGYEIQSKKEFSGIFYPYLTDFYEISDSGFRLVDGKIEKLKEIVLNAKSIIFQTKEIKEKIEEIVGYKVDGVELPPTIPENIRDFHDLHHEDNGVIHIGYAGKVQPRWGVAELIEEVERQILSGKKIRLHIATGKIHGKGQAGAAFVENVKSLLSKDFVEVYEGLTREEAIALIAKMDLVWCYRDPHLEDSTLELSTKLIETAALGKPCIAYNSEINKKFLGEDYSFLIEKVSDVSEIISSFESLRYGSEEKRNFLSEKVVNKYTFSAQKDILGEKLDEANGRVHEGKRIVISGHDLKFAFSYVNYLRCQGAKVAIDPWEWGKYVSLRISEYYSSWGEYIFCEWGLANAVWHSKNKKEGKKLFVRIHAQEVRKKAEKFGRAINYGDVDKFIFVSPLIRDRAVKLFDWPESKALTIPNGVKESRFFDPSDDIKPVLGMVGIVPTTKRLDRALDLLEALNERGWEARLYCKGHRPEDLPFMHAPGRKKELEYYNDLYKRIENTPSLNGYVTFDGWGNDVERWYQKIDFILSPSENESFHYALADGVMAGCIPLVWPWEGAAQTYTSDWVVYDTEDARKRVESFLNLSKDSIVDLKTSSKNLVAEKYFEGTVFEALDRNFWS